MPGSAASFFSSELHPQLAAPNVGGDTSEIGGGGGKCNLEDCNLLKVRSLDSRAKKKGGFGKGGFCSIQRHAQEKTKNTQDYWTQQCTWHSERHSEERRPFLQNHLLKFSSFLTDSSCLCNGHAHPNNPHVPFLGGSSAP